MFLTVALAALLLQPLSTAVVTCDAAWLDREALEQILGPEIREIAEAERADLVLIVDDCSDTEVRLRVMGKGLPKSRRLLLTDTPWEARIRTIALALGELAREPADQSAQPPETNNGDRIPPAEHAPTSEPTDLPKTAEAAPQPDNVHPADSAVETRSQSLFMLDAYVRGFALVKTAAPEARLGIRLGRLHLSLGAYAMGWRHSLGRAYLVSTTLLVGPTLAEHVFSNGSIGLDMRLEIGGVSAFGIANEENEQASRFNVAVGGHLFGWVQWGTRRRFRPAILVGVGWLRGLNVFADDTHLGGFEGLSLVAGLEGAWHLSKAGNRGKKPAKPDAAQ